VSLIVEPWTFANEVDNSLSGAAAVIPGTSNADGTALTLLSALAFDVHYLVVSFNGYNVASAAHYALADILLDPAGGTSWRTFIDDLVVGYGSNGISCWTRYLFPIYIKAGTSVGCRARTSHTVACTTPLVSAIAFGNPSNPAMWWCGVGVETLGVTAATSKGTSVTPGATGAYSSWTNIGSPTSARYGAIQYGGNGTDSNALARTYHFQIGYNNMQLPGSPTMRISITASETLQASTVGPIWCDIPQGTQMQIRGTSSGTAEAWAGGLAIYGVY